jgi:FkbM family methyltransferase
MQISRWLRNAGLVTKHRDGEALLRRGICPGLSSAIHVGAHHGQEVEFYEEMGFHSVLWIEASPEQFAVLERRLSTAKGNHVAVNVFAGETTGERVKLRRFNNDGASSSVFGATKLLTERWPDVRDTSTVEEVPTARVDDIARGTGFATPDLLTVDVQGAELLVFRGATDVIQSVKAIVTEVSLQPFYDGGVLQPELRRFLSEHGFVQARRPPVHGNQLFLRR